MYQIIGEYVLDNLLINKLSDNKLAVLRNKKLVLYFKILIYYKN